MSLSVNRTAPGLGATDAPALPALPCVMRQMQAAPETIREDTENDVLIIPMVALREGVFQCTTCPAPELYLADNFGRIAATDIYPGVACHPDPLTYFDDRRR